VHEATELGDDVLKRLGASPKDGQLNFVVYRFVSRLSWFGRRSLSQNRYHTMIALTVIAAGLLTSGLTAFTDAGGLSGWQRGLVIALGVVVGVGTGLTQILRPAQRSVAYQQAYERLLTEGWEFVLGRGRYEQTSDIDDAFEAFVDAVLDIDARAGKAYELSEPQQQA
jgi:hypothetical protein